MSGVLNDCDALLQGAGVRILNGKGAYINLALSAPGFHLNSAGVADLSVVSVKADMVGLTGSANFSAQGGTLSNASANGVDVTYTGSSAVVTATVVSGGETVTRSIAVPVLRDGAAGSNGSNGSNGTNGTNGVSPPKNAVAFLYKWSTAAPSKPAGTTTFTWAAAANTAYSGNDGWAIAPPANPGTPLIQLFVASIAVSDVAAATTTTVGYTSSIVAAWAQNGANGSNGSNGTNGVTGVQSGEAKVYQWAATIPAGPAGSPSFVWSTSAFGAAPTNWTLTPGAAPSPGMTLWMARVGVTDSAAASSTSFNWTAASILAVGYAGANGSNGSNGGNGAEGASYVTAYCASSTASTTTAPSVTSGKSSVPASNGGGIVGAWTKAVPVLASGQFLYQSDGIYDPATGNVTWSIPYWSSLKVGALSAITANLGAITGGSIDIGSGATSWHVDAQGNMWIGAPLFAGAPVRISNMGAATFTSVDIIGPGGEVVLSSGKTLPEQTRANPNLAPSVRTWNTTYGGAGANSDSPNTTSGEYINLPASGAGYVGLEQGVSLPQNGEWMTLSCVANALTAGASFRLDLFNGGNIQVGCGGPVSVGVQTKFSVTFQLPAGAAGARLRAFLDGGTTKGAQVAEVKLEQGRKVTAWSDDVITPANAATFIQYASIKFAHIDRATITNLSALNSYLGSVEIGPGGSLRQGMTDYAVGVGMWFGQHQGINKFIIGDPNGSMLWWDGYKLQSKNMESILPPRTASISSSPNTDAYQHPRNVTAGYCGTLTAAISGPVSPDYAWSISSDAFQAQFSLSSTTAASVNVYVKAVGAAPGDEVSCIVTCSISDNGSTKVVSTNRFVTFT